MLASPRAPVEPVAHPRQVRASAPSPAAPAACAAHRAAGFPALSGPGARVLRPGAHPDLQLRHRHPHGRMAARQRCSRFGQLGRVDLLLAEQPLDRRPGTARAAQPAGHGAGAGGAQTSSRDLPSAADQAGDASSAARRGHVASRRSAVAASGRPSWSRASVPIPTTRSWWPAWPGSTRTGRPRGSIPDARSPRSSLPSRGPMQVPVRLRSRLVATFNSGFKLKDSGGGFAVGGHAYAPMKPGVATFVRYRNGRVDVISVDRWRRRSRRTSSTRARTFR